MGFPASELVPVVRTGCIRNWCISASEVMEDGGNDEDDEFQKTAVVRMATVVQL